MNKAEKVLVLIMQILSLAASIYYALCGNFWLLIIIVLRFVYGFLNKRAVLIQSSKVVN